MTEGAAAPDGGQRPGQRRVRRRVGLGLLTCGLLLVLCAGWVGWRTWQAYRHLEAAARQVTALEEQISTPDGIDLAAATARVDQFRTETRSAVSASSDPLFRAAAHLPLVGANLAAISTVAQTVDQLAASTAPALVKVAGVAQLSTLTPRNGAIDIAPIAGARKALDSVDDQVRAAGGRIAAIDRHPLSGPVSRAVDTLQGKLTRLAANTGTAARVGRLAPPMLGGSGVRSYLVIFQNLAEPRASGGLIGSYALLRVDNGRLTIADQGSGQRNLGVFDPPVAVPAGMSSALYGDRLGRNTTDSNLTPDFPTTASLLQQMYRVRTQVQVDGVIALDPVALSYLLVGTKPIPIGKGMTLTSSNITRMLLSQVYQLYPDSADVPAREAFLTDATSKAFRAVTNGPGTGRAALRGLLRAVTEHRLLIWSAHPAEQRDIDGTAVAGVLPTVDGSSPTIGLFRDDATGGKLGYYVSGSATVTAGACDGRGHRVLTVVMPLTYSAPASGLPPYVIGYARAGPYVLRTNVLVFAPRTGVIGSVAVDGTAVTPVPATENGRQVALVTIDLRPGGTATLTTTIDVPASPTVAATFDPVVQMTPGITTWKSTASSYSAC